MRCQKCGTEYDEKNAVVSNVYINSFCGDCISRNGKDREDIKLIISKIVKKYGLEVLDDTNRMNALLMDYAPHSDKERKLVTMVMREGVVSQLKKVVNENQDIQEIKVNRCINELVDSIWITETAAQYAVLILAVAIGIKFDIDIDERLNRAIRLLYGMGSNDSCSEKILTKDAGIVSEDAICYAIKNSDAIGYKAFATNVNIKYLDITENIKAIYPKAFLNCINLCGITLSKEINSIGTCAFEGCNSLAKIEIDDGQYYGVIEGVLVDKINKKALRAENDISKEEINIVNGILTICKKTFDHSPVKCVSIPATVEYIEENAFYLTQNLERFEVDCKNKRFRAYDGVLYDRNALTLVKYPQGKMDVAYYLEDTVEEIGVQAFSCAHNIQTVTLTNSLKKIGYKAFEYCINIESIMLPRSVEIIGDRAFQYCEKMQSIILPVNIREIGDCAFYNCISLETIVIPINVTKIGNFSFANCSKLRTIIVSDNLEFVGDGAFAGCEIIEILIKNNSYMETYCSSRGIKYKKI